MRGFRPGATEIGLDFELEPGRVRIDLDNMVRLALDGLRDAGVVARGLVGVERIVATKRPRTVPGLAISLAWNALPDDDDPFGGGADLVAMSDTVPREESPSEKLAWRDAVASVWSQPPVTKAVGVDISRDEDVLPRGDAQAGDRRARIVSGARAARQGDASPARRTDDLAAHLPRPGTPSRTSRPRGRCASAGNRSHRSTGPVAPRDGPRLHVVNVRSRGDRPIPGMASELRTGVGSLWLSASRHNHEASWKPSHRARDVEGASDVRRSLSSLARQELPRVEGGHTGCGQLVSRGAQLRDDRSHPGW